MPDTARCQSILIVEDDPDIRSTLQEILSIEGYSASVASNGRDAVSLLKEMRRPCLILLDLMMPVMNGWEVLKELQEDVFLATIPVVVISAASNGKSRPAGAVGYIKKPVDLDSLLRIIKKHCGSPIGKAASGT